MNTSFIFSENSNKTVLDRGSQKARLEPDDIKTESTDELSSESQSESSREKMDVASPNSIKESRVNEEKQPSGATRTFSRKKQPESLGEAFPANLLIKGEDVKTLYIESFEHSTLQNYYR